MPKKTLNATARFDIRIPEEMKVVVETAAAKMDIKTADSTRTSALKKARQTIKTHESIVLSGKEWGTFIEMLEQPHSPTPAAKQAVRKLRDNRL